jgi:hypothetical protein
MGQVGSHGFDASFRRPGTRLGPAHDAQSLDPFDFFRFETEIKHIQVVLHVLGVAGPSQEYRIDVDGEAEYDLTDGPTVAFRGPRQLGVRRHVAVGCQQREPLIDQLVRRAELSNATIPASGGITSVLNETGSDARFLAQAFKLFEADVADPKQSSPPAVVDGFHRSPNFPVGGSQTIPPRRTV